MSSVDQMLINSLSKEAATQQPNSGMEQQQPVAATNEPAATPVMVEPAPTIEAPITPAAEVATPAPTEQPTFDPNKWLEEVTGGLLKDAESFKQQLPRITEYDKIKQERDTFEQKANQNPFASDYVRILDELVRKGATVDQLNNFQKINAIGDINTLSPIDAKVAKLVLVDGYKESVARKMIEQEYPLSDFEEGSDDKEIMEEKLRVSANTDKAALNAYKAETATINNPQEDLQLQNLAAQKQHESYVKQTVPQIASQINGMGEIAFKDAKGIEQGKLKFDYPAEFKAQIGQKLEEYFMDGQTPINNDTVQSAFKVINATYLDENFPALSQRIWDTAYAKATEDAINKYENKSGLPQSPEVQVAENTDAQYNSFLKGLVGKK